LARAGTPGILERMDENFDVIVAGGGAAGLSAALVLARARRRVLVVDAGLPRNHPAAHMHGFLSRDGLPPHELLEIGRNEVEGYGGTIVEDTITEIAGAAGSGFEVTRRSGHPAMARRLLVATGLRDEIPDLPGLRERWARDVLHCPYCHGFEVRDRRLAVLGWTDQSAQYAQIVRQWSHDVSYLTAPHALTDEERAGLEARSITIVEGRAERVVVQGDRLHGVEVDSRVHRCDALFVPPRFVPNADLLVRLGCDVDDDGWPVASPDGRTSVAGVWVAGNVANPRAQVVTAAGEGSAAAIAINADLVADDVRRALGTA
jgi:thioredoxin reductase